MINWKKALITVVLSLGVLSVPLNVDAQSYTVKTGESLWKISNKFGVSLSSVQRANNLKGEKILPGQTLDIPKAITAKEKQLMAKLVHAEAKGESYAGKVAVATVILNRVDHKDFPDTVAGVVYQKYAGKYYAFSPVENGTINQQADAESVKAVNEAISFRGKGQGSLFFYNPVTSTSDWIFGTETTITIGKHRFAK
ncbi:cell wall hydrolase [Sediminibacillus massiliensis]|uniref:cell wall hydrolase n=1 Tax=Sediminibacillus massiliensis TaxID=1926277 RepID=UPI00098840F3|nr:cell wall hydrolase [Sediminibacillus massiliensis]